MDYEKEDYIIKIPSFFLDSDGLKEKSTVKFFMSQLSNCLIDYKNEFGIEPNEILFNGKVGSIMYNMFNEMFSSVYTCSLKDYGDNFVEMKSNKTKTQKQKQERGVKSMSSFDGKMIEGFTAPSMSNFLTFSYEIEKEVETSKKYYIEIL